MEEWGATRSNAEGQRRRAVVPELLEGFLEMVGTDGPQVVAGVAKLESASRIIDFRAELLSKDDVVWTGRRPMLQMRVMILIAALDRKSVV